MSSGLFPHQTSSSTFRTKRATMMTSFVCKAAGGLLLSVMTCVVGAAQAAAVFTGMTTVGQTSSSTVSVSVKLVAGGSPTAAVAITQSATTSEFTVTDPGSCGSGSFAAGQSCTSTVSFSPKYPGTRAGAVVVTDTNGNVLGAGMVTGIGSGSLAVIQPGVINTVVGDGDWIYVQDGVPALAAPIFLPTGVTEDAAGNLFLSDSNNHRVRRVDAQTRYISTIAGSGTPGDTADGVAATSAEIASPAGIVVDGAGNVYFVDNGNHCVRRVDAFSKLISTVAGICGVQGYAGDGSLATAAKLNQPEGLAMDLQGDLYIADTGNNVVREVTASNGNIITVAGTGAPGYNQSTIATQAYLNTPWGVTVGPDGSLYIADRNNERVRKVDTTGTISTVVGNGMSGFMGDGGDPTQAELAAPVAVVLDPAGNLYVADSGNNRVREVSAGMIQTITGGNSEEFSGDTGPANLATIYGPYSLYFDQMGNLLIADMFHNRIREISGTTVSLSYPTMKVGKLSTPQLETLADDGNANLNISTIALNNAALDPTTTTCPTTGAVTNALPCTLGIDFAPQTTGTLVLGTVTVNSDAANTYDLINLSGQVLSVNPTTATLVSSLNPSMLNGSVTFTDTISSSDTTLGGTVTFTSDGSTVLCSAVAVSSASKATCTTSTLALGSHSIQASYTGDADNAAALSNIVTQVVKQAATVTLAVSPVSTAVVLAQVTLTATVSAATGTPTGTVTFLDSGTAIGSANLISGVATFPTTTLAPGLHSLTAKYSGDTTNATATSTPAVKETITQATTATTIGVTGPTTVQVGTPITLTSSVSSLNGTTPGGTVQFLEGTTVLGSGMIVSGAASFTFSTLAPGSHIVHAYYTGDTDDATSSSTTITLTVQQIGTTTTLVPTPNPANAGAAVELQATVVMASGFTADGAISGQVNFTEDGNSVGSAMLTASGIAVISVSNITAGSHTLVATYVGNTNYAGSGSGDVTETVNSTGTSTALGVTGSGIAGKPVVLTASVSSSTGIPAGLVTFEDTNGASIGQGTLNLQGVATLSTSSLSAATHSLVAVYQGNANYNGSSSTPQTEVIALGTTALTMTGPQSPLDAGLTASFSATMTTNGIAPTGSVILKDGSSAIASQLANTTSTITFSGLTLAIGPHSLQAVYAGDTDNAGSASNTVALTVQQAPSTTTLQTSQNPQAVGQNVTFTATVTSASPGLSNSVIFADGTTTLGSSPLINGVATLTTATLAFGTHTITATYMGDTNHATSTSPAITQHIVDAAQIGLSSSQDPSVSGANVTFTVKVAGNGTIVPTGAVKFFDGVTLLSTGTLDGTGTVTYSTVALSVGSHPITALYAGDSNYSAETSTILTQTVADANTQIALTASVNPATYGSSVTFKAVVTSNGGTATGSISFTDSGVAIGSGGLDGTGTATLTTSTLAAGTHTIVAHYAGDGKASASVSPALVLPVRQTTTVAVASSANPASTLTSITFTAHVTNAAQSVPTGTVTFTDGATQLGVVTIDGSGNATLVVPQLSAGSHSIMGAYSGDAVDFNSVSTPLTQTVQLRTTSTTLSSTVDPNNGQQVTLIAAVHYTGPTAPTGTVVFTTGSTTLGSAPVDVNGVSTLVIVLSNGTENVVATYSGDTAYATSASPATAVGTGAQTDFTLTLNPASATIQSKEHMTTTLTIASLNSFSDTMEFGCLGLPYAATCTFSSTQSALKAGTTTTIQLTIDTGDPLGAGAQAQNKTPTSNVLVCFIPGMLLFGLGMLRSRRRSNLTMLALFLVFGAVVASMTGCGGLTINGTPAGTYQFQVTARATNSGVSESQTMTLVVK